jgi:hypothetical protein
MKKLKFPIHSYFFHWVMGAELRTSTKFIVVFSIAHVCFLSAHTLFRSVLLFILPHLTQSSRTCSQSSHHTPLTDRAGSWLSPRRQHTIDSAPFTTLALTQDLEVP